MALPDINSVTAMQAYEAELRRRYPNLFNLPPERNPSMRILSTPSILSRIRGELVACSRRDDKPQAILLTHREMDELMNSRHYRDSVASVHDTYYMRSPAEQCASMKTVELYRRAQRVRFAVNYTFEGIPLCVVSDPGEYSLTH